MCMLLQLYMKYKNTYQHLQKWNKLIATNTYKWKGSYLKKNRYYRFNDKGVLSGWAQMVYGSLTLYGDLKKHYPTTRL